MKKTVAIFLTIGILSGIVIAGTAAYSLLDTLVIPHAVGNASDLTSASLNFDDSSISSSSFESASTSSTSIESTSTQSTSTSSSLTTGSSSSSSVSKTTITYTTGEYRCYKGKSITYHLVEINLRSVADLHRHIVTDSSGGFGQGIEATVSDQVSSVEEDGVTVLAAINGDTCFYSNNNAGYVIADGKTYRKTKRSGAEQDFALFANGSVLSYLESDYSYSTISSMNGGCYQNWVFGPSLIVDGSLAVDETSEIDGKNTSADPRTAIGYVNSKHFFFLTSDILGSRNSGYGFLLYDLANLLLGKGCTFAYNLDGGGSATMYVESEGGVVNDNTYGYERDLSDMIYVVE